MAESKLDLIVVGAGPAGLSAAARAEARGLSYVLLERSGHLAETVRRYQRRKPVMAEPSAVPLRSDLPFTAGSREEVLGAWERTAEELGLAVRLGHEVTAIEPGGDGFLVRARVDGGSGGGGVREAAWEARRVVLAIGTQGTPRPLGAPGEALPHVARHLVDAADHRDEEIVVVGAGDSALEVALALADRNRVHLVVRRPELVRAKESLEREILARSARGEVTIHYRSTVAGIEPDRTLLDTAEGPVAVAADRVFLQIGTLPPRGFLEGIGVRFASDAREARPVLDEGYESSVAGLHLIGALAGRDLIKPGINQGWEVVERILGHAVEPADEPVLAERLAFWDGPVRERLARLSEAVPLLAEAEPDLLRETFLGAEVRRVEPGTTIVRQDDYTDSFLAVADGRVEITARSGESVAAPRRSTPPERTVAHLGRGEFFGEMSLVSGRRRNATATAREPTLLVEIPRKAMLRLLADAPGVARRVDAAFLVRAFQAYLFPGLPGDLLGELVEQAELVLFEREAEVFAEGEPGDALYLIRSGMVKIARHSGEREVVLSYLTAGSFFGETALLAGDRRTATVTTIFPSELIRLGRAEFEAFLERHPELAPRFEETLRERRRLSLEREAEPDAGSLLAELIGREVVMGTDVLLIDETKCVRCGNCVEACRGVHDDGRARLELDGFRIANLLVPTSCWQCEDPLCMLDCPPDAIVRDASGEIRIKSNCIGCGNCAANCPYDNIFMVHPEPRRGPFGWLASLVSRERAEPAAAAREVAVKCDMTSVPGGPACVRACPTGAALRVSPEDDPERIRELVRLGGGEL